MENEIQIFKHEEFGRVRVIMIKGEPWFVAVDVCRALELENTSQALSRLEDDEKSSIILPDKASKNGVTSTIILDDGICNATSGWIIFQREVQTRTCARSRSQIQSRSSCQNSANECARLRFANEQWDCQNQTDR